MTVLTPGSTGHAAGDSVALEDAGATCWPAEHEGMKASLMPSFERLEDGRMQCTVVYVHAYAHGAAWAIVMHATSRSLVAQQSDRIDADFRLWCMGLQHMS